MTALIASILVSSLLGSPHCAAMCGGFACFYAAQPGGSRRTVAQLAYHGGRLVSYALLGAVAGSIGAGADAAGHMAGLARPAAVAAGLLMIGWGAATIARALGARLPSGPGLAAPRRLLLAAMNRLRDRPPVARSAMLGLLTTLLPCGWLYVFVATAGGTGSPLRGAMVMAAFWIGTVPMLMGLGALLQRLSGPLRQRLPVATAAAMVVIGLLTVAGKFAAGPSASLAPVAVHDHR